MIREETRYSLPLSEVGAGYKVLLPEFGFDEPLIVFEKYGGRPYAKDMRFGHYDLSHVDPRDERHNFTAKELEEQGHGGDATLIVTRASETQGIVLYVTDTAREVTIIDDEPQDI